MLTKSCEDGSSTPGLQATGGKSASIVSEQSDIKECPFTRYGCLGCLNTHYGGCLFGNVVGDEFCLRDRKLNTRATAECLRKGCISAQYVENNILVCTHNETRCKCIDRLGNMYGNLQRTRAIAEVIDADRANESLRIAALLKPIRHASGAVITEVSSQ